MALRLRSRQSIDAPSPFPSSGGPLRSGVSQSMRHPRLPATHARRRDPVSVIPVCSRITQPMGCNVVLLCFLSLEMVPRWSFISCVGFLPTIGYSLKLETQRLVRLGRLWIRNTSFFWVFCEMMTDPCLSCWISKKKREEIRYFERV
jgi:hypothetical protein